MICLELVSPSPCPPLHLFFPNSRKHTVSLAQLASWGLLLKVEPRQPSVVKCSSCPILNRCTRPQTKQGRLVLLFVRVCWWVGRWNSTSASSKTKPSFWVRSHRVVCYKSVFLFSDFARETRCVTCKCHYSVDMQTHNPLRISSKPIRNWMAFIYRWRPLGFVIPVSSLCCKGCGTLLYVFAWHWFINVCVGVCLPNTRQRPSAWRGRWGERTRATILLW